MIEMKGVREYCEEESVDLDVTKGRLTITATNEGGHNSTSVDLLDTLDWLAKNHPKLLIDALGIDLGDATEHFKSSTVYGITKVSTKYNTEERLRKLYSTYREAEDAAQDHNIEDTSDDEEFGGFTYEVHSGTLEELINPPKRYGVIFGRFQPFHLGHASYISLVKHLGYEPLVIVCSAQESGTEKNPYDFETRKKMVHGGLNRWCYTAASNIVPLEDSLEDDASWLRRLQETVESITKGAEYVYFTHNKATEKGKYESLGDSEYISDKIQHKKIDISDLNTYNVSATDIRNDPVGNKQYVTHRVWEIMSTYGEPSEPSESKQEVKLLDVGAVLDDISSALQKRG